VIKRSQASGLTGQCAGPQALVQENLNSLSGVETVSRPATSLPNITGSCYAKINLRHVVGDADGLCGDGQCRVYGGG
jgi:hypothetical protein